MPLKVVSLTNQLPSTSAGQCETFSRAADDPKFHAVIHAIADAITRAFRDGHKLLMLVMAVAPPMLSTSLANFCHV